METSTEYVHCCLPRQIRKFIEEDGKGCASCRKEPANQVQNLAYACTDARKRGRVHYFGLYFCSATCVEKWWADMNGNGYGKLLEVAPAQSRLLLASPDAARYVGAKLIEQQEKVRHWTGATCDGCRAYHFDCTRKFQVCGKCKEVRYCSRECQIEDWKARHKTMCGQPPVLEPEVKLEYATIEDLVDSGLFDSDLEDDHVDCFDTYARHRREALRRTPSACSWLECTKVVEGPIEPSFHICGCTARDETRRNPLHFTPTAYCSRKCREHDKPH